MDARFRSIAALAARQRSVVSLAQLQELGVPRSTLARWVRVGDLQRLGPRSFLVAGAELTWEGRLLADFFDRDGAAYVAGRSAAKLMKLDDFGGEPREFLAARGDRFRGRRTTSGPVVRSTAQPIPRSDLQRIEGLWVVRAERLIIDAPLFEFNQAEIENAIDSAIRRRLVSESRLRVRLDAEHRRGINGSRALLEALVDTGGESRLERWFLMLCRESGLPRPTTQKVFRSDGATFARVDAEFPGGLLVEVAGHTTHSSRQHVQDDEERRTELTIRGRRFIVFTYNDVRYRPGWVVEKIRQAMTLAA